MSWGNPELWSTGKDREKGDGRNSGKEIMRILKRGTDLLKWTKLRVQAKFIIKYHFMLKRNKSYTSYQKLNNNFKPTSPIKG